MRTCAHCGFALPALPGLDGFAFCSRSCEDAARLAGHRALLDAITRPDDTTEDR